MKQVHPNYTFVASTKTITLTGLNIAQDQLLLITNATRGVIYYNFASSSHRAVVTSGANTSVVLTDASTTGHANGDQLVIHYDDQSSTQTVDISSGSISAFDIQEQVRSGVFSWADSELVGNIQGGLGVKNASEFESGISLIRAANFPPNFTNFNGFYRLNYINRASNSDGLYAVYIHCNAADFQEFTPSLKLERASGQWAWAFMAEENVCRKYISAPAVGSYVSPVGVNAFEPGNFGGVFTSVYVVRADAIPTTNPAIGNTHDMPALDATVDSGASGSSLISLGKGIFQKLKFVPSIGANTDTSAASDTGNFSLFSFFKRLLSVKLPNAVSGRIPVDGSGVTQPVSVSSLPLPSGAATSANQATANTSLGATSETAATTDTATSGLNGLLKRLLQRITTLIPANLTVTSNRLDVNPNFGGYFDAYDTQAQDRSFSVAASIAGQGYTGFSANSHVTNLPASYPVTGTVTAQGRDNVNDAIAPIPLNDGASAVVVEQSGMLFVSDAGENYQVGTISLTNNTAAEISYNNNGVNGFSTVVLEISTSGVTWGGANLVAQAHNQAGAATDQQIMCPLGVRINHSADAGTGLAQSWQGTVGYVNLEPNTSATGYHGTRLDRYEYNEGSQLSSLPATGTRFFIFDLTTSRFFLKGNFTAGNVTVNYRLYRTRHPVFSARKVVVGGELSNGGVRVGGDVNASVSGSVYLDGGYLDEGIEAAAYNALDSYGVATNANLGALADSAATTDTGSFSLISLFKRLLQRITSLVPANLTVTSTRLLVDGSGVTQPVSAASLPLPSGAATEATLAGVKTAVEILDNAVSGSEMQVDIVSAPTITVAQATHANLKAQAQILDSSGNQISYIQAGTAGSPSANVLSVQGVASGTAIPVSYSSGTFAVSASSLPLPSGAATATNQTTTNSNIGATTEAAASTDTATSGLNGLIKRLLQRITALIPANLTVTSTRLLVDGSGVTQPVTDRGATGEATVSSFTSTTSATLKASNSNRKVLTIYNEGAGNLHVLYGSGTASTTNYSVKLFSGDYLEIDKYTGQVNAIFATAGTARVTEIT